MGSRSETLILGTRKGLFVLETHAGSWRVARIGHLGIPVAYAFVHPVTGVLWASLDHGHWGQKLARSSDLGASWEEVDTPKYPEGEEIKDGVPATLRYQWVLAPGGMSQPDRLFVGTEPGGLFRSDDGGETFELVRGLWDHPSRREQWMGGGRDHAGIHSVVVDPRDPEHILVGISVAGVFESRDGGATWAPRNRGLKATYLPDPDVEVGHDPHLLVACPAVPDVLWQQNHCGIFRSEDGGASWTDVSEAEGPASFGFAVAVHESRPDTAWVVPAIGDEVRVAHAERLQVCRTEDGGRTWIALTHGLPEEPAYDVVFRHALDVDGDRMAFGSTTGNVYLSDDGGDHFECVGHHFPPVYSVRFAPDGA